MKLTRAISWSVIGQYLSLTLQLGIGLYLARTYITPHDLGSFAIAVALTGCLSALQDFGLSRFLLAEPELTDEKRRGILSVALALAGLAGLMSMACAAGAATLFSLPDVKPVILLLSAVPLFGPGLLFPIADLQRAMRFRALAFLDIMGVILNGAVAIWLAAFGQGALALAAGMIAQQIGRLALAHSLAPHTMPWPPSLNVPPRLLAMGRHVSLLNLCWLIVDKAPDLILGHAFGATGAGLFSRAKSFANQIRVLTSSAASAALVAAVAHGQRHRATHGPSYAHMTRGYCAVAWPALLGVALLADPITYFVLGARWAEVAPLLFWLALSQMPLCMLPMQSDLALLQRQTGPLITRTLWDTATALLLIALAALFGLEAAAASRLLSTMMWFGLHAIQMQRMTGFQWRAMATVYRECGLGAVATAIPICIARVFISPDQIAAAPILFGVIGVGGLAWAACWLIILSTSRKAAAA